ncbi:hypothetical protein HZB89_00730 [archaeon]|nr:hypothetical protein [archaeon]
MNKAVVLILLALLAFSLNVQAKEAKEIMQELRNPSLGWSSQWSLDYYYLGEAGKLSGSFGGIKPSLSEFKALCLKITKAKDAKKFIDNLTGFRLYFRQGLLAAKNSFNEIVYCKKESLSSLEKQARQGSLTEANAKKKNQGKKQKQWFEVWNLQ